MATFINSVFALLLSYPICKALDFSLRFYWFLPHFDALLLGSHTLRINPFLGELTPFFCTMHPSLSLIIFLVLKSAMSEINIATLISFWLVLAWHIHSSLHPFTFKLSVSLYLKWVFKQKNSWVVFFVHSDNHTNKKLVYSEHSYLKWLLR